MTGSSRHDCGLDEARRGEEVRRSFMESQNMRPLFMGYEDKLAYLYGLERFGIKLGLDNIHQLLDLMGNPQEEFPSVHVAGSKGKGSVCAFLDSVLRRAGHKVGLYTSPHLIRFNERIRVDGDEISDEAVVRLTEQIRPHAEAMRGDNRASQPTFFEFTTAMAFQYFREEGVDVAVLEVGMGGRLDATNVIRPEVAVITRLELEHTQHLGSTIGRIAREKAGIIKKGVTVWTLDQPGLDVIRDRCADLDSPLRVVGRELSVERRSRGLGGQTVMIRDGVAREFEISLLGTYQAENAALAFGALEVLREKGWRINGRALQRGFRDAEWPARLELIHRHPTVILDATHTIGGAQRLRESLQELFPGRRIVAVVGVLNDKDLTGIVAQIESLCRLIIITQPDTERALRVEGAPGGIRSADIVKVVKPVARAVETAIKAADHRDVVLITGSLYTAGEASAFLEDWKCQKALEVIERLKEIYLPGDFATAQLETALGKITRKTENPFVVLISTVLSQRTTDPITEKVSHSLFVRYRSASELATADLEEIEEIVRPANFYRTKARAIKEIAHRIHNDYDGVVPRRIEELLKLPLVGRKTANCVLVYGYGIPAIPVDVHCHRIPNRLGLIETKNELETEEELRRLLPQTRWMEVNELFVRHGQTTCTPTKPRCPACHLSDLCAYNSPRQNGATGDPATPLHV